MSIPEDISRAIYDITEKTGETVPGWIRDATVRRLEASGYRVCAVCGKLKLVKAFAGDSKVCNVCARQGLGSHRGSGDRKPVRR